MLYAEPEDELLLLLDQSLTPLVHNVARGHHHFFYASLCVRCFHQACWCAAYHPHVCFFYCGMFPLFITPTRVSRVCRLLWMTRETEVSAV